MGLFSGIFNLFRLLGDGSHTASKIFLIWAIHWNRSAEGVSLVTQVLYTLVFLTRYLDLFFTPIFAGFVYVWLFCFKIFYIASSVYIVFLMTGVYARTREREKAWKFGIYCLIAALVMAIPTTAIFQEGPKVHVTGESGGHAAEAVVLMYRHDFRFSEILWTFSIILESVCVLPQLILLRQTTVPTVLDSYYLLTLGSYRAFYILNWIIRAADPSEHHFDPIAVIFGIIQTALYVDFAWVYFTRQRVKLRAGGVVDSEDLDRGWLVGRLVGKHRDLDEEEEPAVGFRVNESNGHADRPNGNYKWGKRGISVSADDGLRVEDLTRPLTDPGAFEDLSEDEDATEVQVPEGSITKHDTDTEQSGVGNGSEWRDADDKR